MDLYTNIKSCLTCYGIGYRFMKPYTPQKEYTMQELADKIGIDVEDLLIKKE